MISAKDVCFFVFGLIVTIINQHGTLYCTSFVAKKQQESQGSSRSFCNQKVVTSSTSLFVAVPVEVETTSSQDSVSPSRKMLVHWKGEKDAGYSKPLRHLEFIGALEAESNLSSSSDLAFDVKFSNALDYTGQAAMADISIEHYNDAMQYVHFHDGDGEDPKISTQQQQQQIPQRDSVIRAVERCSLIHALYEIIAVADNLNDLAPLAIEDGGFTDLYKGGENENSTWCFRARNYGELQVTADGVDTVDGKEKRYGSRARSMKMERDGLIALTDLLIKFGGKVDLLDPDCKIYIFDGLEGTSKKVLARRIAVGPKTSSIAPNTRICITNTPLEPIAAFSLCNVARVRSDFSVLDPYAGSCTTLLATSMIAPNCQTVGIEIAHNGIVNRDDIRKDFAARGLTMPRDLLHGDSTDPLVRLHAREAIGNVPFDVIIADPPYGIRESSNYNEKRPLEELFSSIAADKESGTPLLKTGGRLVAFVPVTDEESLMEQLPNEELTRKAGLSLEASREQPLNDKLSRWLVSFKCRK